MPGLTLSPWMGYFGPPDMPAEKVSAIGEAISNALAQDDVRKPLYNLGLEIIDEDAATFSAQLKQEYETFGEVISSNDISLE